MAKNLTQTPFANVKICCAINTKTFRNATIIKYVYGLHSRTGLNSPENAKKLYWALCSAASELTVLEKT